MSLSNLFRQKYGTIEQQAQQTKVYEMTDKGSTYIENLRKPQIFETPTFEQVKAKFWEIYCIEVSKNGKKPIISDNTAIILRNVCLYLADSEKCAYNRNKGLMLMGGVGTGKTAIMKATQKTAAFFKLPKMFAVSSVPLIFKNLQTDKDFEIGQYFDANRCFDDVGFSEPTLMIYGQITRPIDSILSVRYDRFINEGLFTHMTTNLSLDNLDSHFDERIIDRLVEMCNIISVKGESLRGR